MKHASVIIVPLPVAAREHRMDDSSEFAFRGLRHSNFSRSCGWRASDFISTEVSVMGMLLGGFLFNVHVPLLRELIFTLEIGVELRQESSIYVHVARYHLKRREFSPLTGIAVPRSSHVP